MKIGAATESSESDSMEVEVEIPPFSKVAISIKMTKKTMKLKYIGTQCTLFVDGTEKCGPTEGYKKEISTESAVVDYGRFQPMPADGSDVEGEPNAISQNDPLANARLSTDGADILYRKKFKETNVEIWRSMEINKNAQEVSFFRPTINVNANECALGDIAIQGNVFLNYGHLIVVSRKSNALSHPAKFEKLYSSNGLDIFAMVPKSPDYKCIGDVARKSGEAPVAKEYCCVAKKYLVQAKPSWTWNTKGLPHAKGTVWSVVRDDFADDVRENRNYDIFSGSFIFEIGHANEKELPSQSGFWLLKGDEHNVKESMLVGRDEAKPLELVQKEQDLIWEGKFFGDGCSDDKEEGYKQFYFDMYNSCGVYVYRTKKLKGYFNLGDTVSKTKEVGKMGHLITARDDATINEHIRLPLYFSLVWREPYKGLNQGIGFWMPTCPAGFGALGGVMTDSQTYPEIGSCYCLAVEHLERAVGVKEVYHYQQGMHRWDNAGKRLFHRDFAESIRIITGNEDRESRTLYALNAYSFSEYDTSVKNGWYPYVLKRSHHNILPAKRLKTYTISDVTYDWSRLERPTATPTDLPTLMVENFSRSRQVITRTLEEELEETRTVSFSSENAFNLELGLENEIDDDNGAEFGMSFSAAWSEEQERADTKSQASAVSVTCDVLAEHRMYAYVTADTYRTRVPWKGKLTKIYWDGSRNVEDIEGMYDAIRIADINVDYGRMTPLAESSLEDDGATAAGSVSVNMESAFGSAETFSKKLADIYYKLSEQQDLVWSYKGKSLDQGPNKVAPISFFKATNYEGNFYALSDIAIVDKVTNNIDYGGDAWPCESKDQVNDEDRAFTHDGSKYEAYWGLGYWPKDESGYEFQDGNLMCKKGQKLRILLAELGRPFNKPICFKKEDYSAPMNIQNHPDTNLKPTCSSADLYPYLKTKCNGNYQCTVNPSTKSDDGILADFVKTDGGLLWTTPVVYNDDQSTESVFHRASGATFVHADKLCEDMKRCYYYSDLFWGNQSQCDNTKAWKYSWIRYLCVSTDERAFPFEEMKPTSKQVLIHVPKMPNGQFVNHAIQHPTHMEKVWESVGYREDMGNVGIYKLKTDDPQNYECLGYVARELKEDGSLEENFDFDKYACVHKRYLKLAHKKGTLWRSSEETIDKWTSKDIEFLAPGTDKDDTSSLPFDYFLRPNDTPKLLDSASGAIEEVWMAPPDFDAPTPRINIYQVMNVKKVAFFPNSDSNLDAFSVWKTEAAPGLYPIGDIFVASESEPGAGILARSINENDDTFRHPLFYESIKTLKKEYNNLFWWPVCPTRFVALGIVANTQYPTPGEFYCVNAELAGFGELEETQVWESQWTRNGAFHKFAYNVNNNELWENYQKLPFFSIGLQGDSRLGNPNVMQAYQIWLVKKEFVSFWVEKPVDRIETSEIRFDLDKMVRKAQPVEIQPTFVINNSQVTQTLTRSIEYSVSKSEYYETTKSLQLGVNAVLKLESGTAKTTVKAGFSRTTSQTTGKETVKTKTDTIDAQVEISEKSKIAVTITGTRFTATVPWTGIQTKHYSDGSISTEKVTGMYTGVSISEISVQYGREVSLTTEEELYGPEPVPRGEDVVPDEEIVKSTYEPKTEIVYRMISAKKTLFSQSDSNGQNEEGIRVWKPDNYQFGTCIIGAMISPVEEHFESNIGFVFFGIKKDAIMNPTEYVSWKEINGHKFWKLTASQGYICPGTAVTKNFETPRVHEYCCFKEKYLTSDSKFLQEHKSEQSLGIYMKEFKMAQANDDQINLIPTGHFTQRSDNNYMIIDDDQMVVREDNFDYDPARPLDLIETTNFEEVAKGQLDSKAFSFWKGSGEGLFSVGSTFKMGHSKPSAVIMLKPNKKFPDYDTLFRVPDSFDKVFTFQNNTIWTLICPAHYRALGVAVTQGDVIPTDVYCIKASFTAKGFWEDALYHEPENAGPVRLGFRSNY